MSDTSAKLPNREKSLRFFSAKAFKQFLLAEVHDRKHIAESCTHIKHAGDKRAVLDG
jgi:hypothetical protein